MTLLSPWILLGLATLAIPVWVHLVRKHNENRERFPSLMLIEQLTVAERSRRTLRDRLLLALRCLAIALAVLAFAAPFIADEDSAADPTSRASTVLLIDQSYSMAPGSRMDDARTAAIDAVESAALRGNEQVAIVAFSNVPRVLSEFSEDRQSLIAALEGVRVTPRATQYAGAFEEATRLLNQAPPGLQRVVLISDLQQSAIEAAKALRMPAEASLDVVRIESEIKQNLAVMDATLTTVDNIEHTVNAVIRNTGTERVEQAEVLIVADKRQLEEHTVSLEPGEETTVTGRLVLAADRASRVQVEIAGDDLSDDNTFSILGVRGRRLSVLVAQPERARRNQSVYIEKAIEIERSPGASVRVVSAADLEAMETFADADVLVLNDLATSVAAEANVIEFVRTGGGLLTVAGTNTRFINNIDVPLMFPTTSANDAGALIVDAARDHPVGLSESVGTTLSNVRIRSWRPLPRDERLRVLARLDTGSPLIVEAPATGGRHLVVTTTLDPAWSNLALEPGFVRLIRSMVDYLAGRTSTVASFETGAPVDLASHASALPEAGRGNWRSALGSGLVTIEDPDGNATRIPADNAVYRPAIPGLYEIHGLATKLPVPVNTGRGESLFAAADPDALRQRLRHVARPALSAAAVNQSDDRRRRLAWYLLLAAALLLCAEGVMATVLGARGNRRSRPSPSTGSQTASSNQ